MKENTDKTMDDNTKKLSFVVVFLGLAVVMLFGLAA